MLTATYPYGTTRKATVVEPFPWRPAGLDPRAAAGMLLIDERGEGHICIGDAADASAKKGDAGTLTFTKGGPTGGYWRFTKDT